MELRRRKVVFQGHHWTCRNCNHQSWVDFSELSPELGCEVCKQLEQAPVDIEWRFRANDLLIASLRDHSVLSLIWVLSALSDDARRSFMFVEPTFLGYEADEACPSAEIDLVIIRDGTVYLSEVKSSWHSANAALGKFVELAVRLRPDVALFAVMDQKAPPATLKVDEARIALEGHGIRFEMLTVDKVKSHDGVYLDLH